jgi:hypothetical protein
LPDKTNNVVVAYRSMDRGETWKAVDTGDPPALSTTAGNRSVAVGATVSTTLAVAHGSGTSVAVRGLDMTYGTWLSQTSTYPVTNSIAGVVPYYCGFRSSDNAHVVAYQGATETVMSVAYRRMKLSWYIRGTTPTNVTHDVISGTTSNAGTQVHYDLRSAVWAQVVTAPYMQIFWTQSDDTQLRTRAFGGTWSAIAQVAGSAVASNTAPYPVGVGNYFVFDPLRTNPYNTAIVWVDGATTKVGHVDSDLASTPASWTVTTAIAEASEVTNSNPGVVEADTQKRLYLFRAAPTTRAIEYTQDRALGTWLDRQLWRGVAVQADGLSGAAMENRIVIAYLDTSGGETRVKVDRAFVFFPKISRAAGTYYATLDVGPETIVGLIAAIDYDAPGVGVSAQAEFMTGNTMLDTGEGDGDGYGEATLGDVAGAVTAVLTVTGGPVTVGVVAF